MTIRRPSERKVWPEQKRFTGVPSAIAGWFLVGVLAPVAGVPNIGKGCVIIERGEDLRADLFSASPVENFAGGQEVGVDGDVLEIEERRPFADSGRIDRSLGGGRGDSESLGRRVGDR